MVVDLTASQVDSKLVTNNGFPSLRANSWAFDTESPSFSLHRSNPNSKQSIFDQESGNPTGSSVIVIRKQWVPE